MIKLNLTYLDSISGGDKAFMHEMLTMFLVNTFPEWVQLKQYAQNGMWDQMGGIAHKMKAPMQMLGVPEASDLVIELEHIGKNKTGTETALPKIEQLSALIQEMEVEIKRMLEA